MLEAKLRICKNLKIFVKQMISISICLSTRGRVRLRELTEDAGTLARAVTPSSLDMEVGGGHPLHHYHWSLTVTLTPPTHSVTRELTLSQATSLGTGSWLSPALLASGGWPLRWWLVSLMPVTRAFQCPVSTHGQLVFKWVISSRPGITLRCSQSREQSRIQTGHPEYWDHYRARIIKMGYTG